MESVAVRYLCCAAGGIGVGMRGAGPASLILCAAAYLSSGCSYLYRNDTTARRRQSFHGRNVPSS